MPSGWPGMDAVGMAVQSCRRPAAEPLSVREDFLRELPLRHAPICLAARSARVMGWGDAGGQRVVTVADVAAVDRSASPRTARTFMPAFPGMMAVKAPRSLVRAVARVTHVFPVHA